MVEVSPSIMSSYLSFWYQHSFSLGDLIISPGIELLVTAKACVILVYSAVLLAMMAAYPAVLEVHVVHML